MTYRQIKTHLFFNYTSCYRRIKCSIDILRMFIQIMIIIHRHFITISKTYSISMTVCVMKSKRGFYNHNDIHSLTLLYLLW